MNKYLVSYITASGCVVLNLEETGDTSGEAIRNAREADNIVVVLSCVSTPKPK